MKNKPDASMLTRERRWREIAKQPYAISPKGMKGFAKIFEAIIASVIILASLTYFFVPNLQMSGWDDNTLHTLSKDALQSLYLNGSLARFVKTDNTTPLIASITDMLPKTVDFSLEVSGVANNIIYIACIDCAAADKDELIKIFNTTDFSYKGRNISIRIELVQLATDAVPADTDALFFFDKTKITTYHAKIKAFLSSGGSAMLLSDLTQADVEGTVGSVFNLTWTGTTGSPGEFDDVYNASKLSHYAARYYANISGKYLADTEGDSFPAFGPSGVRAENDDRDIIITAGRLYVRGNYKVEGNGRTVWLSDYSRSNHNNPPTQAVDRLVKAAVMWASGEKFSLDLIKKMPGPVHVRSSIFVFDEDPYTVDLIVWRVFF